MSHIWHARGILLCIGPDIPAYKGIIIIDNFTSSMHHSCCRPYVHFSNYWSGQDRPYCFRGPTSEKVIERTSGPMWIEVGKAAAVLLRQLSHMTHNLSRITQTDTNDTQAVTNDSQTDTHDRKAHKADGRKRMEGRWKEARQTEGRRTEDRRKEM